MSLVIVLFSIGVFLLALEIIVPGGIVGSIGGVSLIGGIAVLYHEYGLEAGMIGLLIALALVVGVFFLEIKVLPKTAFGKRFFLHSKVEGNSQKNLADDSWLGKECKTVTALAPSGFILIDGKKVDATSRSGFIEANQTVKIVSKNNFRILVSK